MIQEYIGDGVYLTYDRNAANQVTLTTGHHDPRHADNVIYMGVEMIDRAVRLIRESDRRDSAVGNTIGKRYLPPSGE